MSTTPRSVDQLRETLKAGLLYVGTHVNLPREDEAQITDVLLRIRQELDAVQSEVSPLIDDLVEAIRQRSADEV